MINIKDTDLVRELDSFIKKVESTNREKPIKEYIDELAHLLLSYKEDVSNAKKGGDILIGKTIDEETKLNS